MAANKEVKVRTVGKTLLLERQFDAPREQVFEAFSSCDHVSRWYAPKGWSVTNCKMDFRPGGLWHFCLSSDTEDMQSWGLQTYEEIARPERLSYIDRFSDKEGRPNEEMPTQHGAVTLTEENGVTTLVSRTDYDSEEDMQAILEMGVVEGVGSTWERLDEVLVDRVSRAA
jgi:uncharacterized protein YndB with AHSA1/START domain